MKSWVRNCIIFLLFFLTFACGSKKYAAESVKFKDSDYAETQYYKVFTDATKNGLFGNYKTAVALYNACIQEFPEKSAPYFQLSSIYLRAQRIDEAKYFALKAYERDTTNIWYALNVANIYQYQSKLDSAIFYYEKALSLDSSVELQYNLAMLLTQSKKYDEALELVQEIEEESQGSKELIMMKHNIFHEMKMYDSAVYELELATKYFPDDPNSYGMLAEYLVEIKRYDYAQKVYKELLATDPENGLVLLSYAEFFAKNLDLDSAAIFYSRAFCCSDLPYDQKINVGVNFIVQEDFIKAHLNWTLKLLDTIPRSDIDFRLYAAYADIFIGQKMYERAKPYLDSALLLEKQNYVMWEQALLVNNFLNEDSEVVRIATECLTYFPDKPNIYFIRALGESSLMNYQRVFTDLDSLEAKSPKDDLLIQGLNLRAETFRALKEYGQSDSCYEEILKLEPENLMIRNNYAYYLSLRSEKLEKAKELSELTIIREPQNATYLDTYAWILFELGEYTKAKKYIESAIRNGAYSNPEVLDHYGEIMLKLGNCNDAIEAWEKIIEIDSAYAIQDKLNEVKKSCQ